jgi:ribosomal protein S18 acetylase RimI-like enzyme
MLQSSREPNSLTDTDCRLLTPTDVETAAGIIAEAFIDDPLCAFMLPFRSTRRQTLRKFFRAYGQVNIKNARGYGTGDPLQGAAFWIFPGQADLSISLRGLSIFLPLLFTYYPIGYLRAKSALQAQEALHQKYATQPHFYLDNIGVLSAARGKGLASRLIRPFLEQAEAQQAGFYTDTYTVSNVALYEHFGFECVEECPITNTGLTLWALLRPA